MNQWVAMCGKAGRDWHSDEGHSKEVVTCLEIEVLGRPPFEQLGSIFKIYDAKVAPTILEEGLTEANPVGHGWESGRERTQ